MNMNTLPCPFCGAEGPDKILVDQWPVTGTQGEYSHNEYAYACQNCGAIGPNDLGKSGALEQWNMRRQQADLLELADAVNHHFKSEMSIDWDYRSQEEHDLHQMAQAAIAKAKGGE
jgi:predicted ATP-dependent serine protease